MEEEWLSMNETIDDVVKEIDHAIKGNGNFWNLKYATEDLMVLYREPFIYTEEVHTDHEMFKQLKEAVKLKDQEMIREEILKIVKHLRHLEVDEIAEIMKDHSNMYVDCIVE